MELFEDKTISEYKHTPSIVGERIAYDEYGRREKTAYTIYWTGGSKVMLASTRDSDGDTAYHLYTIEEIITDTDGCYEILAGSQFLSYEGQLLQEIILLYKETRDFAVSDST